MKRLIKEVEKTFTVKKIFNFILMFVSSGILFVAILYLLFSVNDTEKKMQCYKYQQYSEEFSNFWISASDKVACDNLDIIVNASVH